MLCTQNCLHSRTNKKQQHTNKQHIHSQCVVLHHVRNFDHLVPSWTKPKHLSALLTCIISLSSWRNTCIHYGAVWIIFSILSSLWPAPSVSTIVRARPKTWDAENKMSDISHTLNCWGCVQRTCPWATNSTQWLLQRSLIKRLILKVCGCTGQHPGYNVCNGVNARKKGRRWMEPMCSQFSR